MNILTPTIIGANLDIQFILNSLTVLWTSAEENYYGKEKTIIRMEPTSKVNEEIWRQHCRTKRSRSVNHGFRSGFPKIDQESLRFCTPRQAQENYERRYGVGNQVPLKNFYKVCLFFLHSLTLIYYYPSYYPIKRKSLEYV